MVLGAAAYAGDTILFSMFQIRLTPGWEDVAYAFQFVTMGGVWPAAVSAGAAVVALVVVGALAHRGAPREAFFCGGLAAALGALHAVPAHLLGIPEYQGRLFENVVSLNLRDPVATPYSAATRGRLAATASFDLVGTPGRGEGRNVVIAVVESLSAYHSKALVGDLDYTPRLDSLRDRSAFHTRFFANSYSTQGGLIALMTGRIPVQSVRPFDAYGLTLMKDHADPSSVVATAQDAGYHTAFLTTGDLAFSDKRAWLESIGVAEAEGAEAPFYEGAPRGWFNAASDRKLYARALSWIEERGRDGAPAAPYLLWLETVTSHWPLRHPEGGADTEEGVIGYAESAVHDFARALEASGFFDDGGVLVVTSDHRTLLPITAPERAVYGAMAQAAIPLVVISRESIARPSTCGEPLSQVDLVRGIATLVSRETVAWPWFYGNALRCERARLVAHVSAREPGQLLVMDAGGAVQDLRLDGDASRVRGEPGGPEVDRAADFIHRARIMRGGDGS